MFIIQKINSRPNNRRSRLIKHGALCLVLIMAVTAFAYLIPAQSDDSLAAGTVSYDVVGDMTGTYDDLTSAFDAINLDDGVEYTVIADGDDLGATSFTLNANKNVTLRSSDGNKFTIKITTGGRHGIVNGSLTLENIVLDGNGNGGGIAVSSSGIFTMNSGSVIQSCYVSDYGGAVYSQGTFTMNGGSAISNNKSGKDGGGVYSTGTFNMGNSASGTQEVIISGNTAVSVGGGVYSAGTFNMLSGVIGGSYDAKNTAREGGGVNNGGSSVFNMYGGEISYNATRGGGSGITNSKISTFNLFDGRVCYNNSGSSGSGYSGGVLNYGTLNMYAGEVSYNSGSYGGGVYNGGTFKMYGGKISNNSVDAQGGGVYSGSNSTCDISGEAVISGNYSSIYGGGVCNDTLAIVSISGNVVISENNANYGGGVCNWYSSTLTISGYVVISDNIASTYGGGVFNWYNNSTCIMSDNVAIYNNSANFGGGVANHTSVFSMNDNAAIYSNSANFGGGVFNRNGPFSMNDNAAIFDNTATDGGGVYNNSDANFKMSGGKITNNTGERGGGIYNAGMLNITSGRIDNNTANGTDEELGSGGGIFTTNFSNLTVADGVVFSGNTAPYLRTKDIGTDADIDGNGVYDLNDYAGCIGNVVLDSLIVSGMNAPAYNNYDINYIGDAYVVMIIIDPNGAGFVTVTDSKTGTVYGTFAAYGYIYVPTTVDSITLSATPEKGNEFKQFMIQGTLFDTDLTVVPISGNVTVVAEFSSKSTPPTSDKYITAVADLGSLITPSGVVKVPAGNSQTFKFSAIGGYRIVSVTVDGIQLTQDQIKLGSYTFSNVVANHIITVVSSADDIGGGGDIGSGGGDGGGNEGSVNDGGKQDWAVLNLICAVIAILAGVAAVIVGRNGGMDGDEKRPKVALLFGALAFIIGIVSAIVFFLTEDWTMPVTAVDEWTVLMFILLLLTLVATVLSFRSGRKLENEAGRKK